jgi:hypothetical protein
VTNGNQRAFWPDRPYKWTLHFCCSCWSSQRLHAVGSLVAVRGTEWVSAARRRWATLIAAQVILRLQRYQRVRVHIIYRGSSCVKLEGLKGGVGCYGLSKLTTCGTCREKVLATPRAFLRRSTAKGKLGPVSLEIFEPLLDLSEYW